MRLSTFLVHNANQILEAWDAFAATVTHAGKTLDPATLRDHAAQILKTVAADLETPQTESERDAKSKGQGDRNQSESAAETHADYRRMSGFAIEAMITEYRALRASVLRLWAKAGDHSGTAAEQLDQLTRFNEAIDQAITESVARYTAHAKKSNDLFIGILGHDIRNPLGTISMSAEALVRTGQLSQKAAAPITNSVIRIRSLIEGLVDFTRAQAEGVMPIERVPGNLANHVAKVIQETQVRFPGRMFKVERTGNFDGSWDEGRIGQLVSNLLANALSYGARDAPVTVRMWAREADVSFSVHNLGTPIPVLDVDRIFEPLVRGSVEFEGERREPGGLGLGLYICREIVLSHRGTLTVTSAAEEGTTFTVSMPRFDVAP
jgi:signal transduction histidine kinase